MAKLYMSYHTNEENQADPNKKTGGCIEVFETKNDQTTMLQYLQDKKEMMTSTTLMVDGKDATKKRDKGTQQVVTMNGGTTGRIALNNNGILITDIKDIDDIYNTEPSHHRRLGTYRFGKSVHENCI